MHPGSRSDSDVDPTTPLVAVSAKRVLKKIDWRLIPLLFVTYNLNFMDKTILSSASVFGLREDTHLTGAQYNWVSSAFYFGYLVWAYPTSFLIQRLPVGKYVALDALFWGAVVTVTAACRSFGSLFIARLLLGCAEATISPAFVHITSMWYVREEVPIRTGIWFAGNSLGGIVASFVAYGVGHIERPLAPWMWLFIVLGAATFCWGIVLYLFLPDSIESAKFLSPHERKIAQERVIVAGTGIPKRTWDRSQCIECLTDPKSWFLFSISLLTQIPNGGTQNFGNLVLKGFGFTSLQTTLVTFPSSIICFALVVSTGWLSGNHPNITTILICCLVIPPIIGSAIIYIGASKAVKLLAYYLLSPGPAIMPLALSLVGVNYKGSTKKLTMTAILFIAYCAGNISGPHLFRASDAPRYSIAFEAIMVSYVLVLVFTLGLRRYLIRFNKRRDIVEGAMTSTTADTAPVLTGVSGNGSSRVETAVVSDEDQGDDFTDISDLKTVGFRYRM